jgi:hypothetical protein
MIAAAEFVALARDAGLGEVNPRLSRGHQLRLGAHGSVAVDTERGIWFDHECGVGGGLKALAERAGMPAPNMAATAKERAETAKRLAYEARVKRAHRADAARFWRRGGPLPPDYYRARCIEAPLNGRRLRYFADCPLSLYAPTSEFAPAILARVDGPDGRFLGLRQTYLTPDGLTRIDTRRGKHPFAGAIGGGLIPLRPSAAGQWVVGEGIETTLSLWDHLGDPGTGAVCALSAGNIVGLDLAAWRAPGRLLAGVRELIVAIDIKDGDAGRRAGARLAAQCARLGITATLMEPPEGSEDWNAYAMRTED